MGNMYITTGSSLGGSLFGGGSCATYVKAEAPWHLPGERIGKRNSRIEHPMDTQERINFCLEHCPYGDCINCYSARNNISKSGGKRGRPKAKIDLDELRRLVILRTPTVEIMEKYSISRPTLMRYKKMVMEGHKQ